VSRKRRCLSASPGLGWRCEKTIGHKGWHKAQFARWSPDEGSTWTGEYPGLATGNVPTWDQATPSEDLAADVVKSGEQFLAGLRANFETMDAAERATDPRRAELADWWRSTAENEIKQTVDKAIEYGSTDLIDIGQAIARVAGREIPDSEAAEWGVFFYLEGKLSRWRSAITRGDLPSFDTLLDIGVYARMAQRIRQEGSWPGTGGTTRPRETTCPKSNDGQHCVHWYDDPSANCCFEETK
jgi:hypothetical protein